MIFCVVMVTIDHLLILLFKRPTTIGVLFEMEIKLIFVVAFAFAVCVSADEMHVKTR